MKLEFSDGALKVRTGDYVIYNREWLFQHLEQEFLLLQELKREKGNMASLGNIDVNVNICDHINQIEVFCEAGATAPFRAHKTDAGIDLTTPNRIVVPCGGSALINTGLRFKIPKGFYGKLESKSGLHCKNDIVCLGGVIDADYRGTVVVKLYNFGHNDYIFEKGDKIVQMVIIPCLLSEIVQVENFDAFMEEETERGENGFGSTGR